MRQWRRGVEDPCLGFGGDKMRILRTHDGASDGGTVTVAVGVCTVVVCESG